MLYPYRLSLKQSVSVHAEGEDVILVSFPAAAVKVGKASPGMRAVIQALSGTGGREEALRDLAVGEDGLAATAKVYYYLGLFDDRGFLCRRVTGNSGLVCTFVPASRSRFRGLEINPGRRYVLSRFAYCRREGRDIVLESPLGSGKVILDSPESMAVVQRLSEPSTLEGIAARTPGVDREEIKALLDLLLNLDALREANEGEIDPEDRDPRVAQWEFHDLLFQARSRRGRHDNPSGATFRFKGKIEPLPARKPAMGGEAIALYRPDLDSLKKTDRPFTAVLEARRSIREPSRTPLSVEQLGEFLFRAARVRYSRDADPEQGRDYETTNRPYPGGGAVYELELYPVINACSGIERGLYHYDPFDHELRPLSRPTTHLDALVDEAYTASGIPRELEVLIVMAARFQRFSWKYASIAYAAILKDVGVLFQNMYLVATAMDLSPCALGSGDSDLFARAAGLDYLTEASVGEFVLGGLPAVSPGEEV